MLSFLLSAVILFGYVCKVIVFLYEILCPCPLKGSSGVFDDQELGRYVKQLHAISSDKYGYPERAAPSGNSWPDIFFTYVKLIFNDCLSCGVINWCRENRYLNGNIKLKELKEEERPARSLNSAQIRKLLEAAERYPLMKIRVLLALGTGLRRGDIDTLKISDIDFENNCIATTSRKTKKSMASRPVSAEVMAELSKYVHSLDVG